MANEVFVQIPQWQESFSQECATTHNLRLTKREAEVLGLVVEGKSNKEVATELFCSKRTVDFHLARIYEKLQVNNRIQAVRRAANLGLLTAPKYMD
ncbi:MAG: response regulator transcription factor [Armatimonadota bacterium]